MLDDITKVLEVRKISDNEFESVRPPDRMGAYVDRAFGGVTSGMSLNAAYQTVSKGFHIYSLQGNFLGPALIDRPLEISIRRIRDTKTFATRMIEASQIQDDGKDRTCLIANADFMTQEPKTTLSYTKKPRRQWGQPEDGRTLDEISTQYVNEKKINKELKAVSAKSISFALSNFDMRFCPTGLFGELLLGGAKHLPTVQDDLSIAEKVSADYIKSKTVLKDEADHASALACLSDMATGFIGAVHNKQSLGDYGVTSSLEFSLRFFSNNLDLNDYHLREMAARVGSEGRSFHEIRIWDKNENLVACMTQQAILRAKPERKKPAKI